MYVQYILLQYLCYTILTWGLYGFVCVGYAKHGCVYCICTAVMLCHAIRSSARVVNCVAVYMYMYGPVGTQSL